MITTNTFNLYFNKIPRYSGLPAHPANDRRSGGLEAQVSLLTLMVGNLLEKSLALAAILTATWRATAL